MKRSRSEQPLARTDSYRVVGMRNLSGARRVMREVTEIPGVEEVDVLMDSGVVNVRGISLPESDEVEAAIADAGFRVS